jgi:hypothetical protein
VILDQRKNEPRVKAGLTHRPIEEKDNLAIPQPGAYFKSPQAKSLAQLKENRRKEMVTSLDRAVNHSHKDIYARLKS